VEITYKHYIILSVIALGAGVVYFAWQEEWILIRHPWQEHYKQTTLNTLTKKKATIFGWNDGQNQKWIQEQIDIIWSETDESENAKQLTQASLTLLFEERIMKKKVYVDAILKTYNDMELVVIFDRNPFSKQMGIRTKCMIIESILKTMRENNIKTSKIRFLVNHQPLKDPHLDFSQSWPHEGFVN